MICYMDKVLYTIVKFEKAFIFSISLVIDSGLWADRGDDVFGHMTRSSMTPEARGWFFWTVLMGC